MVTHQTHHPKNGGGPHIQLKCHSTSYQLPLFQLRSSLPAISPLLLWSKWGLAFQMVISHWGCLVLSISLTSSSIFVISLSPSWSSSSCHSRETWDLKLGSDESVVFVWARFQGRTFYEWIVPSTLWWGLLWLESSHLFRKLWSYCLKNY